MRRKLEYAEVDHATHVAVDAVTGRCFECIGARLRARATTPTARCTQLHDLYNVLQHAELGSDEFAEQVQEALLSPLAEALFDPSDDVPSACACVLALPPLDEVDVMPELLLLLRVRALSGAVSDSSLVAIERMLTQQRRRQAYAAPLHIGDCRALLSVLWSRVVLGSGSAAAAALLNTLVELSDDSEHLLKLVEICGSDERSCSLLLSHLARAAPLRARLVRTLLLAASCANARLVSVFGSFFEDSSSHLSAVGSEHATLLPSVLQKCLLGGAGVETATSTLRQRADVERERFDVTALILALATVPAFAQAFVANDVVEFIVEGLREENGSHSLQRALVHALRVIIDASGARVDRALAAAALRVLALHIIAPALAHQLLELVDEALNVCWCLLKQHVGAAPLSAASHELPLMSPGGADALAASIGERSLSRATVRAGGTDVETVGAHIALLSMVVPLASPDGMLGIASLLDVTAAAWSIELMGELSSLALALTDAAGVEYTAVIDDVVDTVDEHIAPAFIGAALRVNDGAVPRFAECIIALVALSSDAVLKLVAKLLACDFHCVVLQLVERAAHAPSRQMLLSELFVCLFEVAHLVDCNDATTRKRWLDCVCRVPSSSAQRALLLAGGPRRGGPSREEWRTLAEISFACWMCESSIDDCDEARRVVDRYLTHISHHTLSRTALSHVIDVAADVLVDLNDGGFSREAEASLCKHLVEHVSFHRLAFVLAQRNSELYGALASELRRWASQLALEDDPRAQDDAVASLLAAVWGVEHLLCDHVLSLAEVEANRRNVPMLHAVRRLAEHSNTCASEFDTDRVDRFLHAQLLQSRSADRGAGRCVDEIAGVAAAVIGAPRLSNQRARCIGGADSLLSMERLCGYCAQRITAFAECERTNSDSAPISALCLLNALLDSPAHARRYVPNSAVVLSVRVIALSPSLRSETERCECVRLAAMETLMLLCAVHSVANAQCEWRRVFMEQLPLPLVVAAAMTSRTEHRALALSLAAARCSLSLRRQRRPFEPEAWCAVRRVHFELLQASVVGEEVSERRPAVRALESFLRAAALTRDATALCRSPWQGRVVATLLARGCDAFAPSEIALLGAVNAISSTKLGAQQVEQLVARFTVELARWGDGGAGNELAVACYAALFTQPHLLGAARELVGPLARALGERPRAATIGRASIGALLERVGAEECSRRCIDALRRLHFELSGVK